jgi:hypothetical protein
VVVANVSAVAPSSARCTWAAIFGWGCELFVCDAACADEVEEIEVAPPAAEPLRGVGPSAGATGWIALGVLSRECSATGVGLSTFSTSASPFVDSASSSVLSVSFESAAAGGSSSEVGSERLRPSWPAGARSTESSSSVARLPAPVFLLVERLDDAAVFVDALLLTDAVFVDALLLTDVESPAVSSAYATPDPANAPAIPTLTAPAVSHA